MKGIKDIEREFSPDNIKAPWKTQFITFLYHIFNSCLDCINFSCQVRWLTPGRPAWGAGISKDRRTDHDVKSESRLYSEFQACLGYKENLSQASLSLGRLIQSTQNSYLTTYIFYGWINSFLISLFSFLFKYSFLKTQKTPTALIYTVPLSLHLASKLWKGNDNQFR